jgi:hypothetical protein
MIVSQKHGMENKQRKNIINRDRPRKILKESEDM